MFKLVLLLSCLLAVRRSEAATTVIYHHHHLPTMVLKAYPADAQPQPPAYAHEYHPGYTIVAPLTKLAHVTYDSVPISHTPYEHVPLFQRIGHVKAVGF